MIRDILTYNDPLLKEEMPKFVFGNADVNPVELYNDLSETMIDAEGMGLSANQIGIRTRMFVMRAENIIGVINPKIIDFSTETVVLEEGCLSRPNLFVKIKRPKLIKVRFTHPDGTTETKKFDGITARVFQHELDHLNGILHTRRANRYHMEQAKKLAAKINQKKGVLKSKNELSLEVQQMMEWLKA
jgi:peptide deformylase